MCVIDTHILTYSRKRLLHTCVLVFLSHTAFCLHSLSHTHTQKLIPLITDLHNRQHNSTGGPPQALFPSPPTQPESEEWEKQKKKKQKKNEDRRANVWKHNGSRPGGKDRGLQSESRLGNPAGTLLFLHARTWCGTVLWFMFPSWKSSEQRGKCGELDVITQDTGRGRSVSAEEHDDSDGVRDGIILYSDTL